MKQEPCAVCEKMTSRALFKDTKLGVFTCSGKCEHQYILTCDSTEEIRLLRYIDGKIEKTKRDERASWIIAGFGVLLVVAGFFLKSVELFLSGAIPMSGGAFSTRYFEDKQRKLIRTRKRIQI